MLVNKIYSTKDYERQGIRKHELADMMLSDILFNKNEWWTEEEEEYYNILVKKLEI